ncbi:Glycyl-glycine endopeptidase ALE-1 [Diplonema papillatum]|nr:Glycyl-glycine endopeptidase ALE-1 [Diplonema papillatum]
MPQKKKNKAKPKQKPKPPAERLPDAGGAAGPAVPGEDGGLRYDATSVKGCYVYTAGCFWALGEEAFDADDDGVPEIAVDPDEAVLSVVNAKDRTRSFTVSVSGPAAQRLTSNAGVLPAGLQSDGPGPPQPCVTFIATVPPKTIVDLCFLPSASLDDLQIDSDVQELTTHPDPFRAILPQHAALTFPLQGAGPWLCTQEPGGRFTHHFAGNYHAVDFRCAVGTPVVAVDDGVVAGVHVGNTASGVHVSALFKWNSLAVRLSSGALAEYVHLQHGSARVKEGDAVVRGQVLACSGAVGFCPEPHLHFQLLESQADTAVSLPCSFGASSFTPVSGKFYDAEGAVSD